MEAELQPIEPKDSSLSLASSSVSLGSSINLNIQEGCRSFMKVTGTKVIFNDISYTVGKKKKKRSILKDISGSFLPGQLSVIMGSTGAGKSTLIDIIAGRNKVGKIGGVVTINGEDPRKCFNKIGSYIQQSDLLMGTLTVFETIKFCADLHLKDDEKTKVAKVNDIINLLGLTKVKDTMVGSETQRGISGGEMKRTAIGMALVTDPGVIILDEPTSGLDSYNALIVVKILKELAGFGKTVFCTIHQPSSGIFELFENILLLHAGRSVYFGPVEECRNYFASIGYVCPNFYNPADYYIDVLNDEGRQIAPGKTDEEYHHLLADKFQETNPKFLHATEQVENANLAHKYNVNVFSQFYYLAGRNAKNIYRDPRATYATLFQSLFLAILIGTLYLRMTLETRYLSDRFGVIFFVAINQAFSGFQYLNKFIDGKELFMRERAAGDYHITAYYLAVIITEFPGWVFFPTLVSTIVYWMCGLAPYFERYIIFVIVIVLLSMTATSLFVLCGAFAPNPQLAAILAPISIVLLMLFGGFFISLESIPPWYSWFGYLSFFRYGIQALVRNEFGDVNYTCSNISSISNTSSQGVYRCDPALNYYDGNQHLVNLGFADASVWKSIIILISMIIIFRFLAFLSVYFFHVSKR